MFQHCPPPFLKKKINFFVKTFSKDIDVKVVPTPFKSVTRFNIIIHCHFIFNHLSSISFETTRHFITRINKQCLEVSPTEQTLQVDREI